MNMGDVFAWHLKRQRRIKLLQFEVSCCLAF